MADRWIVVHPHRMSRYDLNDRRPLQSSETKSTHLLRSRFPRSYLSSPRIRRCNFLDSRVRPSPFLLYSRIVQSLREIALISKVPQAIARLISNNKFRLGIKDH